MAVLLEGAENRAYRSPYADDAAWPKSVTRSTWASLVAAWKNVGNADQVFAAMVGGECELSEGEQRVLVLLENLAGALSEETDSSAHTVASALANKVHALGVRVKAEDDQTPQEALRDTFAWFLGAEVGGWEHELPPADGLRRSVEEWVGRACNAKGVWPSQAAAVRALVLYGVSPSGARIAAQAAFSARQGKTRVRGNPDSRFFISLSQIRCFPDPGFCRRSGVPEVGDFPRGRVILACGSYSTARGCFS